jgi:hypothetical protein
LSGKRCLSYNLQNGTKREFSEKVKNGEFTRSVARMSSSRRDSRELPSDTSGYSFSKRNSRKRPRKVTRKISIEEFDEPEQLRSTKHYKPVRNQRRGLQQTSESGDWRSHLSAPTPLPSKTKDRKLFTPKPSHRGKIIHDDDSYRPRRYFVISNLISFVFISFSLFRKYDEDMDDVDRQFYLEEGVHGEDYQPFYGTSDETSKKPAQERSKRPGAGKEAGVSARRSMLNDDQSQWERNRLITR